MVCGHYASGYGCFRFRCIRLRDIRFANYLHIPYVKYTSLWSVLLWLVQAWRFFGITSASLYGWCGCFSSRCDAFAVMVRQEIVFAIMGGVFKLFRYSCKLDRYGCGISVDGTFTSSLWKTRLERDSIRFWIITIILVVLGLMTLARNYFGVNIKPVSTGFF